MTGPKDPKVPTDPSWESAAASATIKTVMTKPKTGNAPSRGIFSVLKGPQAGRILSLPIGQVLTMGRSEDCTYRFDDGSLSRVHARVMCIGGQHVISDAGSTNGTFVNDQRIDKPQPLRSGDRVLLGNDLTFTFLLVDEAEETSMRKAYDATVRDGLTGVFNRRYLEERLDAEIAFAARHGTKLSVVILDVDFFKKVNDTHGHLAGDAVLRHLGAVVQQAIRADDAVARYGGEEFVLILRGTPLIGAAQLAERLRVAISSQEIFHERTALRITTSAGVADLDECGDNRSKAALLALADSRLYQAKQSGRNRVVAGLPLPGPSPRSLSVGGILEPQ